MADNKKYYYLKLKDNFFDSDEIRVLESMQNGYKYSNLLLKLYLKSLKMNGQLRLSEFIPYNTEMIAAITTMDIDTVRSALELFKQLKLIDVLDDGTIYMLEIQNFIGESSTEADRKRLYRMEIEEKKQLSLAGGQMSRQMSAECPDKNPPEIRDKRLEIRDKRLESSSSKSIEEEEIKSIMSFCQKHSFKLRKCDAITFINSFGYDLVSKALSLAVTTEAFNNNSIRSYKAYLGKVLNDLTTTKTTQVNITKEAKKNNFTNYQQRERNEIDYEDITGWDNE